MEERSFISAWEYTLDLLARVSTDTPGTRRHAKACGARTEADANTQASERCKQVPASARIEIVERCSDTLVTVSYRDATTGRYGEQVWRLIRARGQGICALSGNPIRRGDPVYRPYVRGRHLPANANWMVLPSFMPVRRCGEIASS